MPRGDGENAVDERLSGGVKRKHGRMHCVSRMNGILSEFRHWQFLGGSHKLG